jgi:hypothetical protein
VGGNIVAPESQLSQVATSCPVISEGLRTLRLDRCIMYVSVYWLRRQLLFANIKVQQRQSGNRSRSLPRHTTDNPAMPLFLHYLAMSAPSSTIGRRKYVLGSILTKDMAMRSFLSCVRLMWMSCGLILCLSLHDGQTFNKHTISIPQQYTSQRLVNIQYGSVI